MGYQMLLTEFYPDRTLYARNRLCCGRISVLAMALTVKVIM